MIGNGNPSGLKAQNLDTRRRFAFTKYDRDFVVLRTSGKTDFRIAQNDLLCCSLSTEESVFL